MAQPTNTYDSYDATVNFEDLADEIYMLDDSETPVLSTLERVTAEATYHEWPEDSLEAAADQESSPNATIEGDDVTAEASTTETRLGNRCQLFDASARVTSTQRVVAKSGITDKLAREMMKKTKKVKKDIEKAILANNASVTGNSSTAREMAGVLTYAVNYNAAGDATAPTGDGTDAWTFGTARAFAESMLKDAVKSVWDDGGSPDLVVANSFNRQAISSFNGFNQVTQPAAEKRITATVKFYETDFAEVVVQADRQARSNCAYVFDTDMAAIAVLQDWHDFELSKTGHSDARTIAWEGCIEVRNRKAHGFITDLTTS